MTLLKLAEYGLKLFEDSRFFDPINASAGTMYSTALHFTPKFCLYNFYQHELEGSVVVRHGPEAGWDAPAKTVSPVHCAAFSPNGEHAASGSRDETVWLWDAQTATATARVEGRYSTFRPVGANGSRITPAPTHSQSGTRVAEEEAHPGILKQNYSKISLSYGQD
ncbi:hypothetical protein FRB96_004618 [Tulasnella sp. 330]|nr:hypothetical protein FRB96_004618 [Tulasnella sp. 330]